jgi:hypothetical protein
VVVETVSLQCRIRGSHSGNYEKFCDLGYKAVWSG